MPLRAQIERYRTHLKAAGRHPRVVRDYCRAVELWASHGGLVSLDADSVRAACRALRAAWIDRLSKKTLHRWLVAVRGFVRFAGRRDLADLVVLPSGYHAGPLPSFLAREEVVRLLDAPRAAPASVWALRDALLLELLYSAGLSLSEAVALDLSDVTYEKGDLLLVRVRGARAREVPAGRQARAALVAYLPRRQELRQRPGAGKALLLSVHGRRLTASGAGKRIQGWARAAGIAGTARALRTSYGAHMMDGGCDARTVQMLMGLRHLASTGALQRCSIGYLEREHLHHPRRQEQTLPEERAEIKELRSEVERLRAKLARRAL